MKTATALKLLNRNMAVFDLALGSAAVAAPAATLRVLGHDEPSPDARHLFRRCGPIWLTFAAAHLVAAVRDEPTDWQSLAWLRATEIATDALWAGSPSITRPGAKAALRLAGVANLGMAGASSGSRGSDERGRVELGAAAMSQFDGQPSMRWSLQGLTDEGDEAWLIRGIARKLYRCPGCHGDIDVGDEHTIVQFVRKLGGTDHHHWHRQCAEEILIPELGQLRRVPAGESSQSRLERRGRTKPGRRRPPRRG